MKLVFIDMDGTLCVPLYKNKKGETVVGFTDEEWFEFCEKTSPMGYMDCKLVMPVVRYAKHRKEEGAKLFVLSSAHTNGETESKKHFVETMLPGLFEEVITVESDRLKLDVIKRYAGNEGAELTECELVEDTYANILMANDNKIKATHISSLVWDL